MSFRKCILQLSKPEVEGPLGKPPYEKPSIAKVLNKSIRNKVIILQRKTINQSMRKQRKKEFIPNIVMLKVKPIDEKPSIVKVIIKHPKHCQGKTKKQRNIKVNALANLRINRIKSLIHQFILCLHL